MTDLGQFAEGFASFRRMIATVPTMDAKAIIFTNLAGEAAKYVANGLNKMDAVDELQEIAFASGLTEARGMDDIQTTISDAFMRVQYEPEWLKEERPEGNGHDKPPALPPILSKADFIKGFIPPDYLIDGILQRRFIYALTGQTGHAKTAVALLMARLVSSSDYNAMLGRHRVEKGRVIYFVGENPDDVRMRVIGVDAGRHDDPKQDNISFIPGVFDINKMMVTLETDTRRVGEVSLIIVDTSAAYFLGNEELSNTQMGAYARVLRRLTTLPGKPCVLVLCHPIKHVSDPSLLLPRGGGAYLAEMDGNLTLWRLTEEVVELHYTKMRGPGFQAMSFRLETIKTEKLKDQKGRLISTVQAVAISQGEEDKFSDQDKEKEDRVLAVMLKTPAGSCATWAADLGWLDGDGSAKKKSVQRICEKLEKAKLTRKERNKWVLTDKGKEDAREAAIRFSHQVNVAAQPSMF